MLTNGIFEVYTPETRKLDLLYLMYIQMDLSIIMRECAIDMYHLDLNNPFLDAQKLSPST